MTNTSARFRSRSVAPSSPASRPSPPGGLRPALTPAAGGAPTRHRKPARRIVTGPRSTNFRSLRFQGIADLQEQAGLAFAGPVAVAGGVGQPDFHALPELLDQLLADAGFDGVATGLAGEVGVMDQA